MKRPETLTTISDPVFEVSLRAEGDRPTAAAVNVVVAAVARKLALLPPTAALIEGSGEAERDEPLWL